jgi:hypothetical protein
MMVKGSMHPSLLLIHRVVVKIGTEAACPQGTIAAEAAGEIGQ